MKKELVAIVILACLLAATGVVVALGNRAERQVVLLRARMAETGGWTPENLTAEVGKPLRLRLTSEDVMHSFAVGQSNRPAVDIPAGEVVEVVLTFDRPGKYTFYCTRWCSVNHWRMRGVIEVTGGEGTNPSDQAPLYATLGIDLDAPHLAALTPDVKPSANRGKSFVALLPERMPSREVYLSTSPAEAWQRFRSQAELKELSDQQVWDLVAWSWLNHSTPQERVTGQLLYAENCAACHGESGAGDGVFADEMATPANSQHASIPAGEMTTRPTNFTDPAQMLGANSAILQGKILRGGMGTGMPYWGPIFTEEQTWALVAYLWTFQFDDETEKLP